MALIPFLMFSANAYAAEPVLDDSWGGYVNEAIPISGTKESFASCNEAWIRANQMVLNGAESAIANCSFTARLISGDAPTQPSEPPPTNACSAANIHCVAPSGSEYNTIQAAVNAASPGEQVWVYAGNYRGFIVNKTGTNNSNVLSIIAKENGVRINQPVVENGRESGILISNTDYVTIEGFEVNYSYSDPYGYGIAARNAYANDPMRGVVLRNNKIQNAGKNGIYFSNVLEGTLDGNEVFNNGEHGIYVANSGSDYMTIANNNVHHNTHAGIHMNGDVWQLGGDGLQKGHVISGNTISNNGQNGINMDGIQDVLIQNNTIYDNARYTIRAFLGDGAEGPKNFTIINNTLIVPGNWESVVFSENYGGHTISNNQYGNCGSNCVAYY